MKLEHLAEHLPFFNNSDMLGALGLLIESHEYFDWNINHNLMDLAGLPEATSLKLKVISRLDKQDTLCAYFDKDGKFLKGDMDIAGEDGIKESFEKQWKVGYFFGYCMKPVLKKTDIKQADKEQQ